MLCRRARQGKGPIRVRWLCLLALGALVSGCAMPAAFTVASMAVDTSSYMMSGKTLSDHGLSLAMDEDCSMMRILDQDDEVCRAAPDYEVAEAALTPLPEGTDLDLAFAAGDEPRGGSGYAQLAYRVHKARTVRSHYLAAGMIDPQT